MKWVLEIILFWDYLTFLGLFPTEQVWGPGVAARINFHRLLQKENMGGRAQAP